MMFIVAVAEDTVYGTKDDAIIFIQHSAVMFPDRINPPWFMNAKIIPTIIATLKARKTTGLLKNIGNAIFK